MNLFDYAAACDARDSGIQQVQDNGEDYYMRALGAIPGLRSVIGQEFQGENIRAALIERMGHPHSHKLWGAIIRGAVVRKLIVPTGQYRACKSEKTHAHPTQVYGWP